MKTNSNKVDEKINTNNKPKKSKPNSGNKTGKKVTKKTESKSTTVVKEKTKRDVDKKKSVNSQKEVKEIKENKKVLSNKKTKSEKTVENTSSKLKKEPEKKKEISKVVPKKETSKDVEKKKTASNTKKDISKNIEETNKVKKSQKVEQIVVKEKPQEKINFKKLLASKSNKKDSSKKVSLIIESDGVKDAYIAGCLACLLDNKISFDSAYAVSSGAIHLNSFLWGRKDWLYEMSINYIPDMMKTSLGKCFKEGLMAAYNYKFEEANQNCGYTIRGLKTNTDAKFGLFNLNEGKEVFFSPNELNDELLKYITALPFITKRSKVRESQYIDSSIVDIIPIDKSVEDGYEKHIIISSRKKDFVLKKANNIYKYLLNKAYKSAELTSQYNDRFKRYLKQMFIINDEIEKGKAIYICPETKDYDITKFSGRKNDLIELFNQGYADLQSQLKEIKKLI